MECPKCKKPCKLVEYLGAKVKVCSCGYDERNDLDQYPEDKKSQKAKGEYCKYKSRV
ncbi:hypothetical protein HOC35_06235 [Candidatus Woesearchaeota archaeon]|jgi:hypothetical protein|nr:hypothetical protein [Candidatus Woesearchaeota archaeon]